MIEIDGSEGGGQVVRTALALSAVTGRSVRVESVRGGRSNPGLRAQHLAAVRLLAAVADADVEGASEGSDAVEFEPSTITGGEYAVEIGTAGSVSLVFDAVLPLAVALDHPLRVTVTGGTDVKWAPTVDYYRRVKLPLLARHGLVAGLDVDRRGFYPTGGGRATLSLVGADPEVALTDRGALRSGRVYSVATQSLADADVSERQASAATGQLRDAGVEVVESVVATVAADCPGSAVLVRLDYEESVAGFLELGAKGTPAESVAGAATDAALDHVAGSAPVDPHMADQLLPVLAVGGGRLRIPRATDHVSSSLSVLSAFDFELDVVEDGETALVESA